MDFPSFETCKRLAAAGWPQDPKGPTREFWIKLHDGRDSLVTAHDLLYFADDERARSYAAPTIGDMLAEIPRRGWGVFMEHKRDRTNQKYEYSWRINYKVGHHAMTRNPDPAEALALVLCQALESVKP